MNKKIKNKFYIELGFKLRQVRSLNRISQESLGAHLNVTAQTVQRYETGEIHIPSEAIHICARELNTPVNFFYGDDAGLTPSNTNRVGLMVAAEIMDLPDDNIRKSVFHLVKSINHFGNSKNNIKE